MALQRRIIFLTQAQIERLTALAQGRSLGEMVRAAVSEYLDRREEKAQERREDQ
jgi:hypothetical protein